MANQVVSEAIVAEALLVAFERFARGVMLHEWLDEVTRPPPDASVNAGRSYSGFLLIVKNTIRRALVVEHRTGPAGVDDLRRHFHPDVYGDGPYWPTY